MKKKTVNKFKRAGVWNIACGVLTTLAYIGFFIMIGVDLSLETAPEDAGVVALFTLLIGVIGAYIWEVFIMFPFFMILTGVELLSKHKKGAGIRLLVVFNILMKLLSAFLNGIFGVSFFSGFYITTSIYGGFLVLTAILTLVSVILDIPALFGREKVLQNK